MPSTPTETDLRLSEQIGKLADQLTDFRVANERRFGTLERELGELKTEVRLTTRRLGWLIATLIALGASGTGAVVWAAADVSWRASTVVSQVQQHEAWIDKLESRLDSRIGKLESRLDSGIDKLESKLDSKLDAIGKQLEKLAASKQ